MPVARPHPSAVLLFAVTATYACSSGTSHTDRQMACDAPCTGAGSGGHAATGGTGMGGGMAGGTGGAPTAGGGAGAASVRDGGGPHPRDAGDDARDSAEDAPSTKTAAGWNLVAVDTPKRTYLDYVDVPANGVWTPEGGHFPVLAT